MHSMVDRIITLKDVLESVNVFPNMIKSTLQSE
jgi:hypothetical protein